MPYPTSNPAAKHDLVGPSHQDEGDDTLPTSESIVEAIEARQSSAPPASNISKISTVYTYADAPSNPKPLSRSLEIIGYADVALSLIRKFTDDGPLSSHMSKCTVGVKRADRPDIRAVLRDHDMANSDSLAELAVRMREGQLAAIVAADHVGRFGILRPMEDEYGGGGGSSTGGYTKHDYALDLYVGDFTDIKNMLAGTATSAASSIPAVTTNSLSSGAADNGLWKPPGGNDDGGAEDAGGSGELWKPPGADDGDTSGEFFASSTADDFAASSTTSWAPPGEDMSAVGSGQKRPRPDSPTGNGEKAKGDQQFHADEGAATADAFYSGLVRTLDTRADSRLYHMRAFNGWVKATQIAELDPRTGTGGKKGSKIQPLRVLDLACGKGGDLGKWTLHARGIRNYVGVDVARGSLKDAAIRARKMRKKLRNRCTFTCADLGSDVPGRPKGRNVQKLLSWSLASENKDETAEPQFKPIIGGGITPAEKFDVVSIQFAIHYMMSSRKRAMRFFHTVSDLLEVGGNLILTTIDARVVVYHLMDLGLDLHFDENEKMDSDSREKKGKEEGATVKVGGGACRIKFEREIVKKIFTETKDRQYEGREYMNDNLYGLQYTFTLQEGEDHSAGVGEAVDLPEWLSPLPALTSLANEAGFELEYAKNFHEFYAERKKGNQHSNAHNALYNMKVLNRNGSISEDEWEISRLYMAVKFRKVRESQLVLEEEHIEGEDDDDKEEEVAENAAQHKVFESTTESQTSADADDVATTAASTSHDDPLASNPKAKALFPMAMMKAKKAAGDEIWADLSSEEKKQRTNEELRKLI